MKDMLLQLEILPDLLEGGFGFAHVHNELGGADLLDGTPIYDIKPYLPYVDSHPDARGGFTENTADYALAVVFPDDLLARVDSNKREALRGVLAGDPRPSYQHDPARVYGVRYAQYNVKFTVDGDVLRVTEIIKE